MIMKKRFRFFSIDLLMFVLLLGMERSKQRKPWRIKRFYFERSVCRPPFCRLWIRVTDFLEINISSDRDLLFTFCKKSSKIKENNERQQAAYAAGSFFTISIVGKLL